MVYLPTIVCIVVYTPSKTPLSSVPISNPRVIGNITLPETMVIRVVLVRIAGDHPAHCESGKFLNQGKVGCRRCHLTGTHSQNPDNHWMYYGNN